MTLRDIIDIYSALYMLDKKLFMLSLYIKIKCKVENLEETTFQEHLFILKTDEVVSFII